MFTATTELDMLNVDSWTNLGYGPIRDLDIESTVDCIHIRSPKLTTIYAVMEKQTAKIIRYLFGSRVDGPLRSVQFEGIAVVFVVSDHADPGQVRFYADVFDPEPIAVIDKFTTCGADYPRW